jgi:hypothetical protein
MNRGWHLKLYSIIAIMLHYDFSLSHNAFILYRIVIASNSYRSEHIGPVIASYTYRCDVIDKCYRIHSLSLFGKIAFKSKYNMILFYLLRKKFTRK